MYNRIVVPLDGSETAECALGHVRTIASGCNVSDIVLLTVVQGGQEGGGYSWGGVISAQDAAQRAKQSEQTALAYINKTAETLRKEGFSVEIAVLQGDPADSILNYLQSNQTDLVIMSTHGRSGISRWAFGSVADRVSRYATVPVLLVSPKGCRVS